MQWNINLTERDEVDENLSDKFANFRFRRAFFLHREHFRDEFLYWSFALLQNLVRRPFRLVLRQYLAGFPHGYVHFHLYSVAAYRFKWYIKLLDEYVTRVWSVYSCSSERFGLPFLLLLLFSPFLSINFHNLKGKKIRQKIFLKRDMFLFQDVLVLLKNYFLCDTLFTRLENTKQF